MKRILFFIAACFPAMMLTAQPGENWYKVFTGKIGNLDATVHLHKAGAQYGGYVWFWTNQWPMMIYSGYPVPNSDSIQFGAGSGPIALSFTGVFSGERFTGRSHLEKDGLAGKEGTCQLALSQDGNYSVCRYVSAQGKAKLPPQYKNESECEISDASIWPEGQQPMNDRMKQAIRSILGMKTATEPGPWLSSQVNQTIATWKKDNGKLTPKEASEMGLSLALAQDSRLMIMFENERWITLARYVYEYSGGAHGNYGTQLYTYSKQTGKRMQMGDIFNANGIKNLPAILNQVARVQYGVKNSRPLTENGFLQDKIDPSANFYITAKGVGFLYAPYEIKSFADGDVNLMIPFTVLGPYLQAGIR